MLYALRALLIACLVLGPLPALAADNTVVVTPGSGVTMRSKDVGSGVQSMIQIIGDASGNPIYGTAGTANAAVISVQGVASGTALPVSAASLPLPALAATSTKQSDGSQKSQVVDGSGNVVGATSNALDINIKSGSIANTTFAVTNTGTFVTQSAVTAASGAFASGSFASGSHASGSFASGSYASGALASGSIASGALVDLVALSSPIAPATATATKSVLLGAQATTAAVNPTSGQQAALSSDTNNNLLVSPGGAPNLAVSQVSVATSDTAVVSARALRRAVTIQQITGTQNVFCNQTTATAGNGVVLPAVVGASVTFNTTSAVRCIAITGAQTVAVAETY